MIRAILAALLIGACGLPALADDTADSGGPSPSASYEASADMRYVDLDTKGNRNFVQEYDGKLYRYMHGGIQVANQGKNGSFELQVHDIGSTEEHGRLDLESGNFFRADAKIATMHHRKNFNRTGIVINGVFQPTAHFAALEVSPATNLLFHRTESEINLALFSPVNQAQWLRVQYWAAEKKGQMEARAAGTASSTAVAGAANVDNLKQDLTVGVGTNAGKDGALALDFIHSEFQDHAFRPTDNNVAAASGRFLKPHYGAQRMTGGELKFRYDATKKLALTGAVTGRQRENMDTQYMTHAVVGSVNAAYNAGPRLSLAAKLYLRAVQVDEKLGIKGANGADGNYQQMDKTTTRGELLATARPVDKLQFKAGYKLEYVNRRDAPTLIAPSAPAYYSDGSVFLAGGQNTSTAHNDVKHVLNAVATGNLPYGIEAETGYKRLQANRSAFGNQPNLRDDVSVLVTVPLPGRVDLTLMNGYMEGSGNQAPWNHREFQNTYRAGLDWQASRKASFGTDMSYESIRYITEGWVGSGASSLAVATSTGNWHEGGMANNQKNIVAGVHARIRLPKGFALSCNSSYTWSKVYTPMHWPVIVPTVAGIVEDFTPRDVRIARGMVSVEYTPAKYKRFTARASYRIDDWVDKTDSDLSGRASAGEIGVSAKF